jgi:uncharacterized protein
MEILLSALILGFAGSFHCVGMCGPIALSLPLQGNSVGQKLLGGTIYNLGRTLTYGIMGGVFGIIGQGFHLLGFQRWVSITMGIIMIASILIPVVFKKNKTQITGILLKQVRKRIQQLFSIRSYGSLFFIGVLNSLLPCGLVYLAIAGAIGTGGIFDGIAYMILFGMGTIPALLTVSILGNIASLSIRNKLHKMVPYIVVFIGVIFIFRGLCLGIPYISPPLEKLTPAIHIKTDGPTKGSNDMGKSCCHKKSCKE